MQAGFTFRRARIFEEIEIAAADDGVRRSLAGQARNTEWKADLFTHIGKVASRMLDDRCIAFQKVWRKLRPVCYPVRGRLVFRGQAAPEGHRLDGLGLLGL